MSCGSVHRSPAPIAGLTGWVPGEVARRDWELGKGNGNKMEKRRKGEMKRKEKDDEGRKDRGERVTVTGIKKRK